MDRNTALEKYCRLNNISIATDSTELLSEREGFAKLKSLKGISIKQSFQPIEFLTGFQQENSYEVYGIDEHGFSFFFPLLILFVQEMKPWKYMNVEKNPIFFDWSWSNKKKGAKIWKIYNLKSSCQTVPSKNFKLSQSIWFYFIEKEIPMHFFLLQSTKIGCDFNRRPWKKLLRIY